LKAVICTTIVDIKKASILPRDDVEVARVNINRKVPIKMMTRKLMTNKIVGLKYNLSKKRLFLENWEINTMAMPNCSQVSVVTNSRKGICVSRAMVINKKYPTTKIPV